MKPVMQLLGCLPAVHGSFQLGQAERGQLSQAWGGMHEAPVVGIAHAWQPTQHIHSRLIYNCLCPRIWHAVRAYRDSCMRTKQCSKVRFVSAFW